MTINEIIEELKYSTKEFPTEAILGARKNKQEVTEILLNNLQEIIDNPDIIFDNELHDFSLYLLAEFKEKRAFPLIIKILNQFDEEDLDYMLGDILTEDLSSILASTFNGDFYSLLNIIENKDKDEFLRASVLDTLAILYNKNIIHKDALLKYLENILEQYENDYDFITSEISCIVCDFKLYELVPKIENLYKGNKLDEKFMKLKDFKEFLDKPPFTTYDYIDDCISSMAWIFIPEHYYSRKDFKIGRNDPCPCGSGKKYKKCCGK